jgi:hypothetical protein
MIHIHITSTGKGEGKTTTATRLWRLFPASIIVVNTVQEHARLVHDLGVPAECVLWNSDLPRKLRVRQPKVVIWDNCTCTEAL